MTAEDWKRRSVWEKKGSECGIFKLRKHYTTYLEVLSDLTNQALEGQLADKKLGGLLIFANLAKSNRSGSESMGLLDTAGSALWVGASKQYAQGRDGGVVH